MLPVADSSSASLMRCRSAPPQVLKDARAEVTHLPALRRLGDVAGRELLEERLGMQHGVGVVIDAVTFDSAVHQRSRRGEQIAGLEPRLQA